MSACLLIITDGRFDYYDRMIESVGRHLPTFDRVVQVDDSQHRLGFAGAIAEGWDRVLATGAHWVVHMEDDFVLEEPVPLTDMIELLERYPHLAQVALKRQAWNDQEKAAGGIVEQHPDDYTERSDDHGAVWTEHRRFFTTNPSVYSTRLCRLGWPQEPHSEGVFTHRLLADPLLRFAFWGAKHAPPTVTHIGEHRTGSGY